MRPVRQAQLEQVVGRRAAAHHRDATPSKLLRIEQPAGVEFADA